MAVHADAVSSEVWNLRNDAKFMKAGAVILEREVNIQRTGIEHRYLIRVLAEHGRRVAELPAFGEDCHLFRARVVLPDGRETRLDSRKDLEAVKVTVGGDSRKETVFRVPGVTADCVVELSWFVSGSPLPGRNPFFMNFFLDEPWPTRKMVLKVRKECNLQCAFQAGATPPKSTENGGMFVVTHENVPACPQEPFGYALQGRPQVAIFYQPGVLWSSAQGNRVDSYWQLVEEDFMPLFFKMKKGKTFALLAEGMGQRLPEGAQARATELYHRLKERVVNLDHLTLAEKAARPKDRKAPDDMDLERMSELKEASSFGMFGLMAGLLEAHRVPFKVVFTADREAFLISRSLCSVFQWQDCVIAVDEPGRPRLWLDPGHRTAGPGVLDAGILGTPCMEMDWQTRKVLHSAIPPTPPQANAEIYACRIKAVEGSAQFRVDAAFTGLQARRQRDRFAAYDTQGQQERLKEVLQDGNSALRIDTVEVQHAQDTRQPLLWQAKGTWELEGGRRMTLNPFQAVPAPFRIPAAWPEQRLSRILFSHLRCHVYQCTLEVPQGWKAVLPEPMDVTHTFGRVVWRASSPAEGRVEVRLDVILSTLVGEPETQADLQAFLGKVEEARRRPLILERI